MLQRRRGSRVAVTVRSLAGETFLELQQPVLPLLSRPGVRGVASLPVLMDWLQAPHGRDAEKSEAALQHGRRELERNAPEVCAITDVTLHPCPPEDRDGVLSDGRIDTPQTPSRLIGRAVDRAQAGASPVTP